MEFSRLEYWSGWPFPSLGDIPNPGIEPTSAALQPDSLPAEPREGEGNLPRDGKANDWQISVCRAMPRLWGPE